MGEPDDLLLPEGTRLVHIGPHKTGTTAVQAAFHSGREQIAKHGVHYAGHTSQPYQAVVSLTGERGRLGRPAGSIKHWRALVAEIERAGDRRVVLSCESLDNARPEAIARLADDLGRERLHVVRMLRRYDKLLPSQWQQSVAGGRRHRYEAWLELVLTDPEHAFWRRHGYRELTQRWARVVGAENVTVVVVDETDPTMLLRVFERFVGLPPHTLKVQQQRANRSLTRGETELLRAFNRAMHQRRWDGKVHYRYIRSAVTPALKARAPFPGDSPVVTPYWALERAAEAADQGVREVEELGVRVVGDLSALCWTPEPPPEGTEVLPAPAIGAESGAAALASVVESAVRKPPIRLVAEPVPRKRPTSTADELGIRELLEIVGERVRHRPPDRRDSRTSAQRGSKESNTHG